MDEKPVTTFHFEVYACTIQEQEVSTTFLMHLYKDAGKAIKYDNRDRLCGVHTTDIFYIISSYAKMSSRYCLPIRHDIVARTLCDEIRRKCNHDDKEI